jgi:hypothetical protein
LGSDHRTFLHMYLKYQLKVGGDEYAGSKLEVPCPFFRYYMGLFGVRGHIFLKFMSLEFALKLAM